MVFTADQENGGRKYGTSLGGCLYAPVHQHFFVARMDFCVDGQQNSIIEYNAKAESEGPHNPTLNGFYFEEKILESELMAVRELSPETARWVRRNRSSRGYSDSFVPPHVYFFFAFSPFFC